MADKRIDEDWKAQAEAEKQKIEAAMGGTGGAGAGEHARNTRVSFIGLVEQLGSQAMSGLGQMVDPRTGRAHIDLDLARDAIDMIGLLEEKTRGNLDSGEAEMLVEILGSLRSTYEQVKQAYGAASQDDEPQDSNAGNPTQ